MFKPGDKVEHTMTSKMRFRLPNGAYTADEDLVIAEWFTPAEKFLEILGPGWSVVSYDPNVTFHKIAPLVKDPIYGGWQGPVFCTSEDDSEAYMLVDTLSISIPLIKELTKKFKT